MDGSKLEMPLLLISSRQFFVLVLISSVTIFNEAKQINQAAQKNFYNHIFLFKGRFHEETPNRVGGADCCMSLSDLRVSHLSGF